MEMSASFNFRGLPDNIWDALVKIGFILNQVNGIK